MANRKLISHSEVDTLNQCEQKHYYAHTLKLESKSHSANLALGTTGHAFMETFLRSIKEGASTEESMLKAINHIGGMDRYMEATNLGTKWITEMWPKLDWKIIAVEVEYRVAVTETLVYPFKADVVVETQGKLAVVDHKFLYDPYPQEVIELLPQLPRYIAGLRNNGIAVDMGIYNMLRTRSTTKDVLTMRTTIPSNNRVIQSFKEQIEGMRRIEEGIKFPMRTANKINCANCQFADLCRADLNGEDTELMKELFFQTNTYGYEDI